MVVITKVNMVCWKCKLDQVYNIGKVMSPNMDVLMKLQSDGLAHVQHGGYMITMRIEEPDDIDRFKKDLGERAIKVLSVKDFEKQAS
jgi:hypothetical protein